LIGGGILAPALSLQTRKPTGGDMVQKKKASSKSLKGLPKQKVKEPSSSQEAKEWLQAAADYLSQVPNSSHALQFVAHGINKFLKDNVPLSQALGKKLSKDSKLGRPMVDSEKITAMTKMLLEGVSVSEIAKAQSVSKSTVEKLRAEVNALRGQRQHGAKPDESSWDDFDERAAKIPKNRLQAILQEIITADDIIPPGE
jgi:hypothetical protein